MLNPPFLLVRDPARMFVRNSLLTIIGGERNLVGFARIDEARCPESSCLKFKTYVGSRLLSQSML